MILHVSLSHYEVGTKFTISYKVYKLIRDRLREEVFAHPKYLEKLPDAKNFFVEVSAKEAVNTIEVHGPDLLDKGIDVFIILPYQTIKEAEDEVEAFVKHLFLALQELFTKSEIPYSRLSELEQEVLNEVVGNKEYEYIDPMPWLTARRKSSRKSDT